MTWVFAGVIVALLAVFWFWPSVKIVSVERVGKRDLLITLDDERQARGWSTAWHWYPSGKRCSTEWEVRFSGIEVQEGWKKEAKP